MVQQSKHGVHHSSREQFVEKTAEIGDRVQELRGIAGSAMKETVSDFKENATEYYQIGVKKAQQVEKNLEGNIRKHPLMSVMVAGLLGMLLGAFWNRR